MSYLDTFTTQSDDRKYVCGSQVILLWVAHKIDERFIFLFVMLPYISHQYPVSTFFESNPVIRCDEWPANRRRISGRRFSPPERRRREATTGNTSAVRRLCDKELAPERWAIGEESLLSTQLTKTKRKSLPYLTHHALFRDLLILRPMSLLFVHALKDFSFSLFLIFMIKTLIYSFPFSGTWFSKNDSLKMHYF